MAIEIVTDKDLEKLSFAAFIGELKDEKQELAPFNVTWLGSICATITEAKTSRGLTKLPGIEVNMISAMNMVDSYFKSNKFQKELRQSLGKLTSDSELDYYSLMLRSEG